MRVVELAGPAGAGKTTLAEAMSSADPAVLAGLEVSRTRAAAGLVAAAPTLAGARVRSDGRWWTSSELRSLAYLHAWRGPLTKAQHRGLVLLDHGPVFRLAKLAAYGPPMVRTPAFRRWWDRTLVDWATILDAVVWLDATDPVLLGRIDRRDRSHRMRGADLLDAELFLSRYREAYATILDQLARHGTPVLRLDTAEKTPEALSVTLRSWVAESEPGDPR